MRLTGIDYTDVHGSPEEVFHLTFGGDDEISVSVNPPNDDIIEISSLPDGVTEQQVITIIHGVYKYFQ